MAETIYGTPEFWKEREGELVNPVPPVEALLLEIYNQLKILNSNMMSALIQFYTTTDGTADIQNDALTGNTVRNVFVDGILLNTAGWSFDSATGTVTLVNVPEADLQVLIQYN